MTMDGAERLLLEETVRAGLRDLATDADAVLADLGWLEMLDAEPDDAIAIVFESLGATGTAATALDDVMAAALGTKPRPDLAVLLPAFAAWEPPGAAAGDHVAASGLATARVAHARDLLVVGRAASGCCGVTVAASSAELRPVRGLDPDAGLHTVTVALLTPATGAAIDDATLGTAVALGRRAAAHEMAGACRTMLDLACEHALGRVQFGRPVASFQAVRHRLAEALVAVEALDATLRAAADQPSVPTAALAKATAGRTLRTVAAHCQQVLAGIGFTTDHAFHRFLKRAMVLNGLFGSADGIAIDLGWQLLATRSVPTLIDL
jgi:hypothetical protein